MTSEKPAQPAISVIVPAHNAAEALPTMMDCLLRQTFRGPYEILIVENGSTDDTLQVATEYAERYPALVRVVAEEWGNLGNARAVGHKNARGTYIYSCDADDTVEYTALEQLYEKAVEGDYDIVSAPMEQHNEGGLDCTINRFSANVPQDEYLILRSPSFCSIMVKRALIERLGDVPAVTFEDAAYTTALVSYAKSVGFLPEPIYHYYRRNGTLSGTALSGKLLETIDAEKWAVEHGNPACEEAIYAFLAVRTAFNLRVRWFMQDLLIEHLRELWPHFENNRYLAPGGVCANRKEVLDQYMGLRQDPMPCNVYISAFGRAVPGGFVTEAREKAFRETAAVVLLDESNCDVAANKWVNEAYRAGNMAFVGQYFALQKIYEAGGLYLDTNIRIHAPLNCLRYYDASFGLLDDTAYSANVFAGCAGNRAFRLLLETYDSGESLGKDPFLPLAERIRNVMTQAFDVREPVTDVFGHREVAVFAPSVMAVQFKALQGYNPILHLCSHDFSPFAAQDGYVTMPESCLAWTVEHASTLRSSAFVSLEMENERLKRQQERLNRAIDSYENAILWRLTKPLRMLLDGVKRLLSSKNS